LVLFFFGHKLFKYFVTLAAFIVGFMIPLFLCTSFSNNNNLYDVNWKIYAPVCIICGLLLALLVYFIFMASLIIIAAITGAIIGKILFNILLFICPKLFNTHDNLQYYNLAFILIGALIFVIFVFFIWDKLLIILTPIVGAFFFTSGVMFIIEQGTKRYTFGSYQHWWNCEDQFKIYDNIHNKYDNYIFWTMICFFISVIILFLIGFSFQSKMGSYYNDNKDQQKQQKQIQQRRQQHYNDDPYNYDYV